MELATRGRSQPTKKSEEHQQLGNALEHPAGGLGRERREGEVKEKRTGEGGEGGRGGLGCLLTGAAVPLSRLSL